jgi:enamine deaminase RidA (YjgF/YER057c/UK114 family)
MSKAMERTGVNPWSWSVNLGFDQAQLVEGHHRQLICSAQDAVDADGNAQHPGDMAAQLGLALDNLEAVLTGADMTLADVVRLNIYTTDVDTLLQHVTALTERFEGTGERFASTLLGVARLAAPELLVALEATAMDSKGAPTAAPEAQRPGRAVNQAGES